MQSNKKWMSKNAIFTLLFCIALDMNCIPRSPVSVVNKVRTVNVCIMDIYKINNESAFVLLY
jgi:hypothetical protein